MKKTFLILFALLMLGSLALQSASPFYGCMMGCNREYRYDTGSAKDCRTGCAIRYDFPY